MYRWFGQEVRIQFLPWNEWCDYTNDEEQVGNAYYHIARSGFYSIEKAKRLIDYQPRHTLLEPIEESVSYMLEHKWFEKEERK